MTTKKKKRAPRKPRDMGDLLGFRAKAQCYGRDVWIEGGFRSSASEVEQLARWLTRAAAWMKAQEGKR